MAAPKPYAGVAVVLRRHRVASRGIGYAWYWYYDADGPDGTAYRGHRPLASLVSLLKRRYPGVTIVEPWKEDARIARAEKEMGR